MALDLALAAQSRETPEQPAATSESVATEPVAPHDNTRVALRRLAVISATMIACGVASYAVPGLARVRPWVAGEGVPVVRLFVAPVRSELPEFEGGGAAVASATPDKAAAGAPSMEPDDGDSDSETHGTLAGSGLTIDPAEYAELTQPIEFPEALGAFYAALQKSAQGQTGAITRIAHYGDSAIAADEITHTVRRKLQKRFGDAGHGFMLIAHGTMHYLHYDIAHRESDGWDVLTIVQRQMKNGHYGYGGVVARGAAGEHVVFGTVADGVVGQHASRFELFYQKFPGGGDVRLVVDGTPEKTISTRATDVEDAWESVLVPDGAHMFSVRALGNEVRLYGIAQEREGPGVVYDSIGLVGAQAVRLLNADAEHMAAQIAHRKPDLLVLGFGGNEAGNEWLDTDRYAEGLTRVVKLMRAGNPGMSCLLFAPLDQGERNSRGDLVSLKVLPAIVEAQRKIAKEQGCAYYDTFQAMGGQNSVARWFRKHPRLISSDFRHATPAGYIAVADQYYKALIKGFADYLAQRH